MRRWLSRILICLILGAITTVAVAWACAALLTPTRAEWKHGNELTPSQHWRVASMQRSGIAAVYSTVLSQIGVGFVSGSARDLIPSWADTPRIINREHTPPYWHFLVATGWPMLALTHRYEPRAILPVGVEVRDGIEIASETDWGYWGEAIPRGLPLRPLWPGFVLDTLLYAAIWFAPLVGVASAKRAIRRRRGRCPMCGYDLRGQAMALGSRLSAVSEEKSDMADRGLADSRKPIADGRVRCPECGWNRNHGHSP